ncbi:MAG: response regulator [Acidobacteria bacterium]|nr:response regulator [Acidobacteriota bacterium]
MNLPKNSILLVDDRPANRYSVAHALKRAGYTVVEAETGQEGLDLAKQLPSAIILSVKLPDIIGYEVCRRLKANPRTGHIPVLQLSAAFVDNESRVYALESGADAYLTQPVEPNVLIATIKSLVKLHEAESIAKLSAAQWQATFDALSEGVAVLGPNSIIERCNRALSELLELPYAEIEGKRIGELLDGSLNMLLSGENKTGVQEITWGSRYLRARIEPVDIDGTMIGGIFILADLTFQKMTERTALLNERLVATGRIAHTIAHEINNPLEAITNLLYLLGTQQSSATEVSLYLSMAEAELARVSRIAKQILSFHRESPQRIQVELTPLIEDVLALNNREITEKHLRVDTICTTPLTAEVFPAQLRQVLSNIIRNAIEAAAPRGHLVIKISRAAMTQTLTEPGVRISIADDGVGIARENLPNVFDAFFTTKPVKGAGIGLWLASTIIQEHRGRIRIRSSDKPGHSGTVVSVHLPAKSAADTRPIPAISTDLT